MSAKMTSFWFRTCETVLLVLAFLLPLAFFLQTYDVAAIKTTIFEIGTVVLAFAWLFKGLERGRWEMPSAVRPLAYPAIALLAWFGACFAASPYKIAELPVFLKQILCLATYLIALLEFGGVQNTRRFFAWITGAAWLAGIYGACQHFGIDPIDWKAPHGSRVLSTLGDWRSFELFLALAFPLTLTQWLDPERDDYLRWADAALLVLICREIVWSADVGAFASLAVMSLASAIFLPIFFPSRSSFKAAGFCILPLAATIFIYDRMVRVEIAKEISFLASSIFHELGYAGGALALWFFASLFLASWQARRRFLREGALSESCYVAGLCAAVLGLAVCAGMSFGSRPLFPSWLIWPLAGMLGGLTVLARRGAFISVLPLALREPIRRRVYAPAMLVMLGLLVFPIRWFDSEIENNLALHHARLGEYDQAIAHCDKVFPGAESYVSSRLVKGDAYLAMNDPQDALKTYATMQELSPDYGRVNFQQGLAYAKLGDWSNAAQSYARQTTFEPTSVASYVGWSHAALNLGDLGAAETAAAKAVELEPNEPSHKLALAEVYAQEKRLAQSRRRKINVGKSVNQAPKKPQG